MDDLGEYDFGERELTPLTYIPGTIKYYADGVLQPTPAVTAGKITVPAATYTQDTTTGAWGINPGVSTPVISGTV